MLTAVGLVALLGGAILVVTFMRGPRSNLPGWRRGLFWVTLAAVTGAGIYLLLVAGRTPPRAHRGSGLLLAGYASLGGILLTVVGLLRARLLDPKVGSAVLGGVAFAIAALVTYGALSG